MPFVKVGRPPNAPLIKEISLHGSYKIALSPDLLEYFSTKKITVFVDIKNKLLGLQNSGMLNITTDKKVYVAELKEYRIRNGRYPVKWSEKHKMIIAEIEFDE